MKPTNASIDARVREAVYDGFLTESVPLSRAQVAGRLSVSVEDIAASYGRLAEAHMLVLQPESGEVLMANPFSAVPTGFRVTSRDRAWWANCIWDALGVLAMIAADGEVETSCPDCGEAFRLRVSRGDLEAAEGLVHFAVPAAHWWDDVVFT